jgi:membrane fusion protein (multidrug efflux system)
VEQGADSGMATRVVVVNAERAPINESLSLLGRLLANESVDIKDAGRRCDRNNPFRGRPGGRERSAAYRAQHQISFAHPSTRPKPISVSAESKFARARDLAESRGVTQHELEEARATFDASRANVDLYKRQIEEMRIVAPFSGVIGARMISPGQVVAPQQMLTTIVNLDPVKVELNVPEQSINRVEIGQKNRARGARTPRRKICRRGLFYRPAA